MDTRITARRRMAPFGRTLAVRTKWLLLLGLAAWFAALAAGAAALDTFPGDAAIARAVQGVSLWGATAFLKAVSALGNEPVVIASFVVGVAALWGMRRRPEALLLLSAAIPDLLSRAIKLAVARPRPPGDVVRVLTDSSQFAFPSGHAVHAAVFFGSLVYLTWRFAPGGVARAVLLVLWGAIILVTGVARVYLGAHWPSDVLGGYVLGALSLLLMVAAYERYRGQPRAGHPDER